MYGHHPDLEHLVSLSKYLFDVALADDHRLQEAMGQSPWDAKNKLYLTIQRCPDEAAKAFRSRFDEATRLYEESEEKMGASFNNANAALRQIEYWLENGEIMKQEDNGGVADVSIGTLKSNEGLKSETSRPGSIKKEEITDKSWLHSVLEWPPSLSRGNTP